MASRAGSIRLEGVEVPGGVMVGSSWVLKCYRWRVPVEFGCFWCTRGLGGLTGSQLLPGCAGVVVPGEVRLLWSFKLARGFLAGQPSTWPSVGWVACSPVEVCLFLELQKSGCFTGRRASSGDRLGSPLSAFSLPYLA